MCFVNVVVINKKQCILFECQLSVVVVVFNKETRALENT